MSNNQAIISKVVVSSIHRASCMHRSTFTLCINNPPHHQHHSVLSESNSKILNHFHCHFWKPSPTSKKNILGTGVLSFPCCFHCSFFQLMASRRWYWMSFYLPRWRKHPGYSVVTNSKLHANYCNVYLLLYHQHQNFTSFYHLWLMTYDCYMVLYIATRHINHTMKRFRSYRFHIHGCPLQTLQYLHLEKPMAANIQAN